MTHVHVRYSRSRNHVCYAIARPSVARRLSVTFVRPTQPVEIVGNFSTPFGTLAILNIHRKFYEDRPRGTPSSGV